MAVNTFGQDISKGGGSIVPTAQPTPAPAMPTPTPTPAPAPAPSLPVNANGTPYNTNNVTTPSAPVSGDTGSSYYPRYGTGADPASDYLNTFQAPKSVEQIQQEKTTAAQGQIDSLNKYYDSLLQEQSTVNQGRDRGTNAISVLNGLAGSTDANNAATETTKLNANDNAKIQNERAVTIGGVLSKIRSDAVTEAQQSRLEARQSAEGILKNRKDLQDQAYTHLTNLAKGGVTADGLKSQDPQSYEHLVKQVGSEEEVKALFTLNIPKETIQDTKVINGHYVVSYVNPLTGKLRIDNVDLKLPQGSVQVADTGGAILFGQAGPDGKWDGNMATTTKIDKTLAPGESQLNALRTQGLQLDNALKSKNLSSDAPDFLGQQLAQGLMAPSELSKRATGSASYSEALKAANDYSQANYGKPFNINKANRDSNFAKNPSTLNTLNFLVSLTGDKSAGTTGNIDDLLNASNAVDRTNFPAINSKEYWALMQSGDTNVVKFLTTSTEVADQVAKILQGGGTGSGTSDAKLAQAVGLFNSSFSKDQMTAVVNALRPLLTNRAQGMVGDNPYLSDYADKFGITQGGKNTQHSDADPLGLGI